MRFKFIVLLLFLTLTAIYMFFTLANMGSVNESPSKPKIDRGKAKFLALNRWRSIYVTIPENKPFASIVEDRGREWLVQIDLIDFLSNKTVMQNIAKYLVDKETGEVYPERSYALKLVSKIPEVKAAMGLHSPLNVTYRVSWPYVILGFKKNSKEILVVYLNIETEKTEKVEQKEKLIGVTREEAIKKAKQKAGIPEEAFVSYSRLEVQNGKITWIICFQWPSSPGQPFNAREVWVNAETGEVLEIKEIKP